MPYKTLCLVPGDTITFASVNRKWFKVPIQGRRRKWWKLVRRVFAPKRLNQFIVTATMKDGDVTGGKRQSYIGPT